jgi:plasmid stabilization system protein ParE
MTDLILLLQADHDIQSAFNRYEEFQAGRGEVFIRHLDAALTLVRQHPELAPVYGGRYRRMLIRNFPFGIFYEVLPQRIVVGAILDLRQDPETIRRKLLGD